MTIEVAMIISIVSVCFSIFFGLKNSKRTDTKDIEEKAKANAELNFKLDMVLGDLKDIKSQMNNMQATINEHTLGIARLDSSYKSLHKRVDEFQARLDGIKFKEANYNED